MYHIHIYIYIYMYIRLVLAGHQARLRLVLAERRAGHGARRRRWVLRPAAGVAGALYT